MFHLKSKILYLLLALLGCLFLQIRIHVKNISMLTYLS